MGPALVHQNLPNLLSSSNLRVLYENTVIDSCRQRLERRFDQRAQQTQRGRREPK